MSLLSRFVCLSFVTFFLLAPTLVHGQQALENPGNGEHYSGVGVISGWKCPAGHISIRFNDGPSIPLAYGSERRDVTEQGLCGGNRYTGFVALYNWARLGNGTHTAVAYDNGVEFARSTFTVGTMGVEFLLGARASVIVRDFPREGDNQRFEWTQSSQHLEMVNPDREPVEGTGSQSARAWLGNPTHGANYSGISVVSGWKCDAGTLTYRVDGGNPVPLVYGMEREPAVRSQCGRSDAGFVAIQNWANFGAGEHTLVAYDNGVEFARSTFTVGHPALEGAFITGASARVTVGGLPFAGQSREFAWNESTQHLEIVGTALAPGGPPSFGAATIAEQRYTQNTAIPPLTLPQATGGTAPLVYSLSPALPAGLSFNQSTRMLSGTPTSALATTSYTYTVTDNNGATASLSFSLTVSAETTALSFGNASIATQSYTENTAISSLTLPQATGGVAPLTYSLSPTLPAGLSFNASTRELSGTPTAALTATTYTYTVTDANGATAMLSFSLTVETASGGGGGGGGGSDVGGSSSNPVRVNYLRSSNPGNLETAGDEDYFQIDVPREGIIVARTTGSTDTVGTLMDSARNTIGRREDDTLGQSRRNFLVWGAVGFGTYYVKVEGYGTGRYTLDVEWYDDVAVSPQFTMSCSGSRVLPYKYRIFINSRQGYLSYPRNGGSYTRNHYRSGSPGSIYCISGRSVCVGADDNEGDHYGFGLNLEDTSRAACKTCPSSPGELEIGTFGCDYY